MRARALLLTLLSFFALAATAAADASTGGAQAKPRTTNTADRDADPAKSGGAEAGEPAKPSEPAPAPQGEPAPAQPLVPGTRAKLLPDGTAAAPAAAPPQVQQAIWATNARLLDKPYRYGGGHGSFTDSGYDCSGTVSFAFNAAGALKSPLDSSSFMRWGDAGRGQWLTVYANSGHAYAVIAGLRLDTSSAYVSSRRRARTARKAFERGPRWRPSRRPSRGFTARHPAGL